MLSHHVGRYMYVGMQYMLEGGWRQNGTEGEEREREREREKEREREGGREGEIERGGGERE